MIRFRIFLTLFVLAPTLIGTQAMTCACDGSPEEVELLTSGGEVAVSETYSLSRASMGSSFETLASSDGLYEANAFLGSHLSETRTSSDHYVAYQNLSRRVVGDLTPVVVEEATLMDSNK